MNFKQGRNLRQCFASAVVLYQKLLQKTEDVLQSTLGLTKHQVMAGNTCPACFGPSRGTGISTIPSVNNCLIVALDGKLQHHHQKKAGSDHIPLVTPDVFVLPLDLEAISAYITKQERLNKVPKKVRDCNFKSHGHFTTYIFLLMFWQADFCTESHKGANNTQNETTWKGCDNTGIMGSCCQHDSVIFLPNIHGPGETWALPLTILKRIMDKINPEWPVGLLYNIGCSLHKYINLVNIYSFAFSVLMFRSCFQCADCFSNGKRNMFPEWREQITFSTSVFHAYVHKWPCQVKYNLRYQKGLGMSNGKSLEWLWSALSPQVSPLRYATSPNRLAVLAHWRKYHNWQGIINLS